MSSDKYSYPHPILGNYDDIEPELNDDCVVAGIATDDKYHNYRFVMKLEDATILDLIANNKAQYAIRYKCKDTLYEGTECGQSNVLDIRLPRKEVVGRIDFHLFVIATESFTYKNPSANPNFLGCSFDIYPNEPLVFFPKQWDYLDLSFGSIKHYSSILVPVPDENLEGDEISIITDEKIEVHISKEAYESLKVANKPENSQELISSYVQTALLTALYQLFYYAKDISEIRENDKAWVQAILKRMRDEDNLPSLEDVFNDPFEEIPNLVQKLLLFPMGALLKKLINNVNIDDEDELFSE